jgi:ribonuclease HI
VKNQDLWKELLALSRTMDIRWYWLAGHRGHPYNEECDRMVQREIKKIRS